MRSCNRYKRTTTCRKVTALFLLSSSSTTTRNCLICASDSSADFVCFTSSSRCQISKKSVAAPHSVKMAIHTAYQTYVPTYLIFHCLCGGGARERQSVLLLDEVLDSLALEGHTRVQCVQFHRGCFNFSFGLWGKILKCVIEFDNANRWRTSANNFSTHA